jgi:hypothetical protein
MIHTPMEDMRVRQPSALDGKPLLAGILTIAAAAPRAIGRFDRKKQIAPAAFVCILEDRMYA